MSVTTHISAKYTGTENSCLKKFCVSFTRHFSLDGHFNYAFIYGSWEIIRARKVGTTHTQVDYVVYRLFYPVVLIGSCLFSLVKDQDLAKFFSLASVWNMILHISYAFIFLKNVLANNLHRENVKHRQKIPERLVVTEEIEKGGHKYYICKRYSILPTDKLYYTERFIWFLFNILASTNILIMLAHMGGQVQLYYDYNSNDMEGLEDIRIYSMGILILADVILTPIPIRFAHAIFPVIYFSLYYIFLIVIFKLQGTILYKAVDWNNHTSDDIGIRLIAKFAAVIILHAALTGLSALRDYVISLLDDSRTPKQLQNLRSQKRLARRKLMNYIEGPGGRIVGISLERRSIDPGIDEYIKKVQDHKKSEDEDSEDELTDEINMFKNKRSNRGGRSQASYTAAAAAAAAAAAPAEDTISLTTKSRPPPAPRYATPKKDDTRFSSSSSSPEEDELEAIKRLSKRLPSAPKDPTTKIDIRMSDVSTVVTLHKLGVLVKPRDSKENIYMKMEHPSDDSPPTPPFVKLVQTLIKITKQTKLEAEHEKKTQNSALQQETGIHTNAGSAVLKVVRARSEDEKKIVSKPQVGVPNKRDNMPDKRKAYQSGATHTAAASRGRGTSAGRATASGRRGGMSEFDKFIDALPRAGLSQKLASTVKNNTGEQVALKQRGPGGDTGEKPIGSRVVHLNGSVDSGERQAQNDHQPISAFHKQLSDKLQKVNNKRLGLEDKETGKNDSRSRKQPNKQNVKKKPKRLKGILKKNELESSGENRRPMSSKQKKREERLAKRREERARMGKHGKPVYDPLMVPKVENDYTSTTFHYVGTKLKGDKAERTTVPLEDVPLYRSHPGIGTMDDAVVVKDEVDNKDITLEHVQSVVTFHPIVRYFEVNEVKKEDTSVEGKQVKLKSKPNLREWVN